MAEVEKVSEEQAGEALQQLLGNAEESESEQTEVEAAEPSEAAPVEEQAEPEVTEQAAEAAAEDDLESLRKRNEELESATKETESRYEKRMKALQERTEANESILRDRYLRKSTAVDRALRVLRATKSSEGVSEADVEQAIREIEGTMNPQSASYAPPEPQYQQPQYQPTPQGNEDQALILNSFLNEKQMTAEDAESFTNWVRTQAGTEMSQQEQAVAAQSLDGFLRLAHGRWNDGIREKENNGRRDDAAAAVRSVQRTQREAARAAAPGNSAPKKQPAATPEEVDVSKLTPADVSALLRKSVEQYR